MTELAVVNASPLIFLSRADLIGLLQLAGKRIWVPKPVADESFTVAAKTRLRERSRPRTG
ncbi:MAG: hypothetical protein AAFX50_21205 [Acidobacteriota bacterium]